MNILDQKVRDAQGIVECVKGQRNKLVGTYSEQIWDNLGLKISNDSSGLQSNE